MNFIPLIALAFFLSGCMVSYRKRDVTITDSSGNPAAGQTVSYYNMAPFPFVPPVKNPSEVLDENGRARLRMPKTVGGLWLNREAAVQLNPDDLIDGFEKKTLLTKPFFGAEETKWRVSIQKPNRKQKRK